MSLEEEIKFFREQGDLRGAATKAVEGYGPEVFGFLAAVLRDENEAREVFSQACEDMWKGLGRFQGRCPFRTWFYILARHAIARARRSPERRPGRRVALSEVSELAARTQSRAAPYLRTSIKDQFAEMRNSLPEPDRMLLVLRVDRSMSWREIARTLSDEDSDAALRRREAQLRKRFQLIKEKIRTRARKAGLFDEFRP